MAFRTDFVTQSRHIVPRVYRAGSSSNRIYPGLLANLGFAAFLLVSAPALAQTAPDLGAAFDFTVLGTNAVETPGTVTCTTSTINGDVGSTGGLTNNTCTLNGDVFLNIPDSPIVNDFDGAYGALDTANPTCGTINGTLAGESPVPGVYCIDPSGKTGTLTLSGNASDVWVFKSNGDAGLAGTNFNVVMGGTANACNVYWWTEAGAAMTTSNFKGTILAGADITVTGGNFDGRALATGDVTMTGAILSFAGCAAPATITVSKDFSDDNTASVPVDLSCTTGAVDATPLNASEAAAAVFTVGGADPGATCTATETVPVGYTADETDCLAVELDGSCTIINTLIEPPPPPPPPEEDVGIPTLSGWAMIVLAAFLAIFSFAVMRRRPR